VISSQRRERARSQFRGAGRFFPDNENEQQTFQDLQSAMMKAFHVMFWPCLPRTFSNVRHHWIANVRAFGDHRESLGVDKQCVNAQRRFGRNVIGSELRFRANEYLACSMQSRASARRELQEARCVHEAPPPVQHRAGMAAGLRNSKDRSGRHRIAASRSLRAYFWKKVDDAIAGHVKSTTGNG